MVVSNVVVLSVRTIACNGIILDPIDSRIFAKKYHEWWNFRFIFCFIVRHFISVEDIELYMYMYCECITPHPCWKAWICGVSVCVCVCNTSACVCCTAAGWEAWGKHSAWRRLSTDGSSLGCWPGRDGAEAAGLITVHGNTIFPFVCWSRQANLTDKVAHVMTR